MVTEKRKSISACLQCGQSFVVPRQGGYQRRNGTQQTYCSKSCASIYKQKPRSIEAAKKREAERIAKKNVRHPCQTCGMPTTLLKRFCSVACRPSTRKPASPRAPIHCEVCGCSFVPRAAGRPQIACSSCSTKREKAIRQARSRARGGDRVSPWVVFDRDNWCCWICGEATSSKYASHDPKSPTMDHVIPLSKGGTHCYDNVRCAHAICNAVKSDSLAA